MNSITDHSTSRGAEGDDSDRLTVVSGFTSIFSLKFKSILPIDDEIRNAKAIWQCQDVSYYEYAGVDNITTYLPIDSVSLGT